ncbi:hypothetical protein L7F22_020542 [Adiantum nelumboides]|nr:hypothetical protein [Adiantum nelumboides]
MAAAPAPTPCSTCLILATLTNADGLIERMGPIVKNMGWFFMFDDIVDDPVHMGADLQDANLLVDTVLTVFQGSYSAPCCSPSAVARHLTDTAAEWWQEMCVSMAPTLKDRFSKAFCDYLDANRVQVPFRESRHLPDLETYMKVRANSIGLLPCIVLIEHAQGFELDEEALSHPLLTRLVELTTQHVILMNDIASFKKEYMQGDFWNVVFLLFFRDLYNPDRSNADPAPTLQASVLEAVERMKRIDEECVELMAKVRRNGRLMGKQGMAEYLEGLGLCMAGNVHWHLVSGRYGISATPDLHSTPPDFLADHHLQLQANKHVSHNVPRVDGILA